MDWEKTTVQSHHFLWLSLLVAFFCFVDIFLWCTIWSGPANFIFNFIVNHDPQNSCVFADTLSSSRCVPMCISLNLFLFVIHYQLGHQLHGVINLKLVTGGYWLAEWKNCTSHRLSRCHYIRVYRFLLVLQCSMFYMYVIITRRVIIRREHTVLCKVSGTG